MNENHTLADVKKALREHGMQPVYCGERTKAEIDRYIREDLTPDERRRVRETANVIAEQRRDDR